MLHLSPNRFLHALREKRTQIGLWLGLSSTNSAEALASTGFDWLLIDAEHAPNNVQSVLDQLRAIAPYAAQPVVRPVVGDVALIKQYLDIGAQNLLIPMIDTPEHAALMASAMRYPPQGIRGVGAGLARASRWNQIGDYLDAANDEVCLLIQAETPLAMRNLAAIAGTEGVDGVFFGPADLSANMGFRGQPNHPEVQKAILEGITTVKAAGKAAGILMTDRKAAQSYIDAGALFVAVGVDTSLLVRAASELASSFKSSGTSEKSPDTQIY